MAALLVLIAGAAAAQAASAVTARVISVNDKAELHLVRAFGETLLEEGKATGTLPGTAKIRLHIDAARDSATASFTFYVHGGTLSGESSGQANGGHAGWESFSGAMHLNHGSGRYAHASGSGHMYGAIYRRTDKLIVQETGQLHY